MNEILSFYLVTYYREEFIKKNGFYAESGLSGCDSSQEVVKSANRSIADFINPGTQRKSSLNTFWSGNVAQKNLTGQKFLCCFIWFGGTHV